MSKNFVQHRGCKKLAAIKPPNLFCLLSVELAGKSSDGIRISWLILPPLLCQIFTFSSRKTETKIIIYLHSNAKQNQKQTKDSTMGSIWKQTSFVDVDVRQIKCCILLWLFFLLIDIEWLNLYLYLWNAILRWCSFILFLMALTSRRFSFVKGSKFLWIYKVELFDQIQCAPFA